jgi:hypothetical protein
MVHPTFVHDITKKAPQAEPFPLTANWRLLRSHYRNIFTIFRAFGNELKHTCRGSEQCMIFSATYTFTCVKTCTALTNQNVTSLHNLTTKTLDTQALGLRIATVTGTTTRLLVSHFPTPLSFNYFALIAALARQSKEGFSFKR